ncbi:MAG TPA: enolase C-terminal domain-like protein, partial [Candidatus Limnocylindrales bacterium]|nr:enolase C-terminal domain-like protein [Candidatus Limnocylindrales bacterium]
MTLPPRRVHNWASKMRAPIGRHYILRLETDDGLVGWGEAPALATWGGSRGAYFGETSGTVEHVVRDYLLPALEDQDPRAISACHAAMDRAIKGHPYAKAAVDMALYDICGKAAGVPVYQLLGGKLRDAIPLCHSLGIMENAAAIAEAEQAVAEGIGTIKCKTGLDPERDIALVRDLRATLGPDIVLRVDANEAYRTAHLAARVTRAMEPYDLRFHEQPVAGFEGLAAVARLTSTPVMADESAWTTDDVLRLHDLGAASIISLYVTKPGGLYRAMQVATVAAACDITCDIGGSIEMGIGVAANLHLGVAVEALHWASVCPVPNPDGRASTRIAGIYYLDDIIREPLRFEEGLLYVPDGPG